MAADYEQAEQIAHKRFVGEDKGWTGPRYIALGAITLIICITTIYMMSTMSGCSLQVVPF
jgi:hypothetical protein